MSDPAQSTVISFKRDTDRLRVEGGLENGGGGGNDGGMEARVAKLETSVEYIQRDVTAIRASIDKLVDQSAASGKDLATAANQLTHVPTKLGMWVAMLAVLGPIGAVLWWLAQQFLGPLIAKALA